MCVPVCYRRVLIPEEVLFFPSIFFLVIGNWVHGFQNGRLLFELTTSICYRDKQSPLKVCIKCLTGLCVKR